MFCFSRSACLCSHVHVHNSSFLCMWSINSFGYHIIGNYGSNIHNLNPHLPILFCTPPLHFMKFRTSFLSTHLQDSTLHRLSAFLEGASPRPTFDYTSTHHAPSIHQANKSYTHKASGHTPHSYEYTTFTFNRVFFSFFKEAAKRSSTRPSRRGCR